MNLERIKHDLMKLCIDVSDTLPDDLYQRIIDLRKQMIHCPQWIEKTAHHRVRALECLWTANLPNKSFEDVRWQINRADGWMDEAMRVYTEECRNGLPKQLSIGLQDDVTDDWVESKLDRSDEAFITSQDLYNVYVDWMNENEPDPEVLTILAFGKRLGNAGFDRTTKKVGGKAVKGWKIEVV